MPQTCVGPAARSILASDSVEVPPSRLERRHDGVVDVPRIQKVLRALKVGWGSAHIGRGVGSEEWLHPTVISAVRDILPFLVQTGILAEKHLRSPQGLSRTGLRHPEHSHLGWVRGHRQPDLGGLVCWKRSSDSADRDKEKHVLVAMMVRTKHHGTQVVVGTHKQRPVVGEGAFAEVAYFIATRQTMVEEFEIDPSSTVIPRVALCYLVQLKVVVIVRLRG
mmetsp:Transcript_8469/g.19182  ORF Transcript_8469/g.19182 Transcript_8469/m.19182 type:complete len:221 (-) Transcript_8469:504-1166(-)